MQIFDRRLTTISLFILFLVSVMNLSAQDNINIVKDEPKPKWTSRLFGGGNLGLQFGNSTFIDISPLIGYRITDKLAAGIGVTYQYIRYKDIGLSTNVYGGRVFARYYILDELFLHSEYEVLTLEPLYYNSYYGSFEKGKRTNVESYLVGGGYRQMISGNLSLNIMVLWNLNETVLSPYSNPIIRMGVNIGI